MYLLYTLIYNFETYSFPTNAILYLVAVSALLCRLSSSVKKLKLTPETNKTAFIAYKIVFAAIFLESLALVICVDGFKIQLGIITWIIYMSALMILFMVFLTLTLDEYVYRPDLESENNSPNAASSNFKDNNQFSYFVYGFFIITFCVLSFDLVQSIWESEHLHALTMEHFGINLHAVAKTGISPISDVFHRISKDISYTTVEYILSGLLQAATLISVILLIVFK